MAPLPLSALAGVGGLWPYLAGAVTLLLGLWAACHAILHKRDSRAALAWVGFIWFVPVLGPALYLLLGINRIRRRVPRRQSVPYAGLPEALDGVLPVEGKHLRSLARLVGAVTGWPLVAGNHVEPFPGPDLACAAMLEAIRQAGTSVTLSTYIFDNDPVGRLFLAELPRAVRRGVEVRVLVDDVGAQYSRPSVVWPLRHAGVPLAVFIPRLRPRSLLHANLRNHRKILVVDGRVGFTGGMNIRDLGGLHHGTDLHFRVEGPVVGQLQEVFAGDWEFSTGERLEGKAWFPPLERAGGVPARGIPGGPDEDFETLPMTLLGALACAESSVRILTPYFLPDLALITSLGVAALRGVAVDILLPARSNLPLVQWASMALLWQVLERGCRVWLSPPPFDHGKLMLVDGAWALVGSGNWDPRSLRLNFEFNLECYGEELAGRLDEVFDHRLRQARPLTLADVEGRSLPVKLRDGLARLLSPYL
jgi:cardiolipin synthase